MGKRLVIKGADFSANGMYEPLIDWYNNGAKYSPTAMMSNTLAGVGLVMSGKTINTLRFYLYDTSGLLGKTVKVYLATSGGTYTGSEPAITTYTITQEDIANGYVTISWSSAVTVGDNQAIMVVSDVALVGYAIGSSEDRIPYIRTDGSLATQLETQNSVYICMEYGYIHPVN